MCSINGTVTADLAVIVFSTGENASRNVAGLPAVARAVRTAVEAGFAQCWIYAGPDWRPTGLDRIEIERLADGASVHIAALEDFSADFSHGTPIVVVGEVFVVADGRGDWHSGRHDPGVPDGDTANLNVADEVTRCALRGRSVDLAAASRRIVAATGKPSDGIVSRHVNRPISQTITGLLLHWPAVRPILATIATGIVAIVMLACLTAGGNAGLILGALLFQAASILDGVDGEIARATFRTSHFGAMVDSLVDAATNVGFIGGVVINLWIQGHTGTALFGAGGLAIMAFGLLMIGGRARKSGGQFTFNGVKEHFVPRRSPLMQSLTWLTMRDFYALAAVLFVLSGFAGPGLVAFSVVAAGWFVVVLAVLQQRPG